MNNRGDLKLTRKKTDSNWTQQQQKVKSLPMQGQLTWCGLVEKAL
jgi:hypothetical protein